jgi:hypothetical protein
MITHNDAERLYIALDKLLQNYDFLTIVDNGSTDETIHLGNYFAMRSAGRVSFFGPEVWRPDNSLGGITRARNFGLQNAAGDWILVLDCDEAPENNHKICPPRSEAFPAYFLNWTTHWHNGLVTFDYKLALIRRDYGLEYDGLFHENPISSARRLGIQCGMLDTTLIHRPRITDIDHKKLRYVETLQLALKLQPNSVRLNWFLGLSLYSLGVFDAAEAALIAAAHSPGHEHPIEQLNAALLLGYRFALQGRDEAAERWLQWVIKRCKGLGQDVEMVAYGRVKERIGTIWQARANASLLLELDPQDLFYCGWPVCNREPSH